MIFMVLPPRIKFGSWYYLIEEWIDLEHIYKQKGINPMVKAEEYIINRTG
jgi:hypothetical protein